MASSRIALGEGNPGPKSVEQITDAAEDYPFDANIPLRLWFNTANNLLREAAIYDLEGDEEMLYFLYYRHAHLVLAHLPTHPGGKDKASRQRLKETSDKVKTNLETLDELRPRLKAKHERYVQSMKELQAYRQEQARKASEATQQAEPAVSQRQRETRTIQAQGNEDLAVRLAQKEFSRRAARSKDIDCHDVSRRLQEIRTQVESPGSIRSSQSDRSGTTANTSAYRYPTIPTQRAQSQGQSAGSFAEPLRPEKLPLRPVPVLPFKPQQHGFAPPRPDKVSDIAPARPRKVPDAAPARPEKSLVRPDTPEARYTFAPAAFLENGQPLRTIFLPQTLRTTFLRLAYKNTLANLETCAFLAGTLVSNALFISNLIVPAQTATSDTCEMTNESQLFDYVDSKNDLMILGWIHTHPSQTCFMSSRDLHTHAGYQMMLAESIAIVCAPSKGDTSHGGDWGAYRLTDPPGKKTVLSCEKPGVFHPHDVENIYTDALRPGHVVEVSGLDFEVVDLRAG